MRNKMTQAIASLLNRQGNVALALFSILLALLLGIVDVATGLEVHIHFLYVLPIALASWFVNRKAGFCVALLCDLVVLAAEIIGGRAYSARWIPYGNFLMRGGLFLFVAAVLAEIRSTIASVSELAGRDMLTGLPNGRAFYDLTAREIRSALGLQSLSLAFVDVDGFKWLNQRLGYATGDQVLCIMAQTIKLNVPRPDLVGRVGGTAFAFLLPNVSSDGIGKILETVQKKLVGERRKYAQPLTFHISAIACARAPRSVAELIHEAESRITRLRGSGKDEIEIAQVDSMPSLN